MSSHLLLVEDEPGLRLTVSDLLAGEGYDVVTSSDGYSGLSKASTCSFDVFMLLVILPGKYGL